MSTESDTQPITLGETLAGRYRITKRLGVGGMAIVYLAHDNNLDVSVALEFPLSKARYTRVQRA